MIARMPDASQPVSDAPSQDAAETPAVVSCGPADRAEQSRLYAACFAKPLAPGGLEWRYDGVPHGPSVSVVARPRGGDAVSGYACNPRLAVSRGDDATLAVVGETGDVMTRPEWRKRGLFSGLDRAAMGEAQQRGWAFAFGLPNRRSAHIFLELGWRRIGTVRPWTFVLRVDEHSRAWRRRDGWWKALGIGRLQRQGERARAAARSRLGSLVREPLQSFPREVEQLSRRVEPRFAFMLRRTKDYLDWRFLKAPSGLHRALALRGPQRELLGYVVVQSPRPQKLVGYLIDLVAADDRDVPALIELGLAELERAGASVVEATAIDGSWWSARLAENGFGPPRADNHLTVIQQPLQPQHRLTLAAANAADWYFTDGDRDDETMG